MDRERKIVNIKRMTRNGHKITTPMKITVYKGMGILPLNGGKRFSITVPGGPFEGYATLIVNKFTDAVIVIDFISEECKELVMNGKSDEARKHFFDASNKAFEYYGIVTSTV